MMKAIYKPTYSAHALLISVGEAWNESAVPDVTRSDCSVIRFHATRSNAAQCDRVCQRLPESDRYGVYYCTTNLLVICTALSVVISYSQS